MNTWDLLADDIEPHHPKVLLTEEGIARGIGVNLPTGDLWQEHETHEHVWLVVLAGEIEVEQNGHTKAGPAGTLFHFGPHERREVRAHTDARFFLFLAPYPAPGRQA